MEAINTHDQLVLAGGGVAIMASHAPGRTPAFYGWAVYRVNAKGQRLVTDKDAAWYDYGKKVFSAGHDKMAALETAKQWVAAQGWYDGKWVRNRMRDYIPEAVNKAFPLRRDR